MTPGARPPKPHLADVPSALWRAVVRFNEKGGWVLSSHLAMSMILALFPFILFTLALAGLLAENVPVDDLIELIFGTWPDAVAKPITREVRAVLQSSDSGLLTVGGLLAVFFASNGVEALRLAMSRAYRNTDSRPWWQTRLQSLLFVVLGGGAVLALAIFGVIVPVYWNIVTQAVPGQVTDLLRDSIITNDVLTRLLTVGFMVLAVTAFHHWLPGLRLGISRIWPGIVLTIVAWGIVGWGFAFYLVRFSTYSATYAGLAGVISALIFLYLMGAILILGAEFNGALIDRPPKEGDAELPGPQITQPTAPESREGSAG